MEKMILTVKEMKDLVKSLVDMFPPVEGKDYFEMKVEDLKHEVQKEIPQEFYEEIF